LATVDFAAVAFFAGAALAVAFAVVVLVVFFVAI
jgi:hypothetical protein